MLSRFTTTDLHLPPTIHPHPHLPPPYHPDPQYYPLLCRLLTSGQVQQDSSLSLLPSHLLSALKQKGNIATHGRRCSISSEWIIILYHHIANVKVKCEITHPHEIQQSNERRRNIKVNLSEF